MPSFLLAKSKGARKLQFIVPLTLFIVVSVGVIGFNLPPWFFIFPPLLWLGSWITHQITYRVRIDRFGNVRLKSYRISFKEFSNPFLIVSANKSYRVAIGFNASHIDTIKQEAPSNSSRFTPNGELGRYRVYYANEDVVPVHITLNQSFFNKEINDFYVSVEKPHELIQALKSAKTRFPS